MPDRKISADTPLADNELAGNELIPVVKSGQNRTMTPAQVASLVPPPSGGGSISLPTKTFAGRKSSGTGAAEALTVPQALALLQLPSTEQTGDYEYVLADANTGVDFDSADPVTVTVPADGGVAFPVPTTIYGYQMGAGAITFEGDVGVTIISLTDTFTTNGLGAFYMLEKKGANLWLLTGDVGGASGGGSGGQPLDQQLTDLAGLVYAGSALMVVRVKSDESGFELAAPASAAPWQEIYGVGTGAAQTFTLGEAKAATEVEVYAAGLRLKAGENYTMAGAVLTVTAGTGDAVMVRYQGTAPPGGGTGGGGGDFVMSSPLGQWTVTGNVAEHTGLDGGGPVFGPLGHGTLIIRIDEVGPYIFNLGFAVDTANDANGSGDYKSVINAFQTDGWTYILYGSSGYGPAPTFGGGISSYNGDVFSLTWDPTGHYIIARSTDDGATFGTPVNVNLADQLPGVLHADMHLCAGGSINSPYSKFTVLDSSGWVNAA